MAEVIQKLQFKRGTCADLTALLINDDRLSAGEPAYELDTGKMKIGDGVKNYADLPYFGGGSGEIQQLVYNDITELPTIGNVNTIYVIRDGNSYIWNAVGHYKLLYVNNAQLISINGDVAERQIDGGAADADYIVNNYII